MESKQELYQKDDQILTVGDGDLSFSKSLTNIFKSGKNLTATTLDSLAELKKKYDPFIIRTLKDLSRSKSKVFHEIDATKLEFQQFQQKFDKIVWNFPHNGFPENPQGPGFEHEDQWKDSHKQIIQDFLKCSQNILNENGQIHITNKTVIPFSEWNLKEMGEKVGLKVEIQEFDIKKYPGYENRRGNGKNPARRFPAEDAKTYIFQKL